MTTSYYPLTYAAQYGTAQIAQRVTARGDRVHIAQPCRACRARRQMLLKRERPLEVQLAVGPNATIVRLRKRLGASVSRDGDV